MPSKLSKTQLEKLYLLRVAAESTRRLVEADEDATTDQIVEQLEALISAVKTGEVKLGKLDAKARKTRGVQARQAARQVMLRHHPELRGRPGVFRSWDRRARVLVRPSRRTGQRATSSRRATTRSSRGSPTRKPSGSDDPPPRPPLASSRGTTRALLRALFRAGGSEYA